MKKSVRAKKADITKIKGRLGFVVGAFGAFALQTLYGQTWQPTADPLGNSRAVICSGNGSIFYTLAGDNGALEKSTNGGASWADLLNDAGSSISCSADGSRITINGTKNSTNSGATFSDSNINADIGAWSANGNMLVAIGTGIFITTNNGATWNSAATLKTNALTSVALSADGRVIATATSQSLYISTNSGQSWSNSVTTTTGEWTALACTADGTRIIAAMQDRPSKLFVSQDSGKTWRSEIPFNLPQPYYHYTNFQCLSLNCSADGGLLVTSISSPGFFISQDFGASWVPDTTPGYPDAITCSYDGTLLVASSDGYVVTQNLPPPLTILPSASQLTLSWPAPSTQYTLQQASDLSDTNWLSVTNAITVTNYRNQVILAPPATGNAFYRLHGPTP